jgi:hypothetical protein
LITPQQSKAKALSDLFASQGGMEIKGIVPVFKEGARDLLTPHSGDLLVQQGVPAYATWNRSFESPKRINKRDKTTFCRLSISQFSVRRRCRRLVRSVISEMRVDAIARKCMNYG